MADYSDPKRAVAYRFTLSLFARSDNQIKTTPTLAAGDVKVSKDNGATANITALPTEAPASSGILQVDLSATEMTADLVTVIFRDAAGAEWNDVAVNVAPSPVQMGDLATAANLATVGTVVDSILVDTAEIGVAGAGLTNINLPDQTMNIVGNITGNLSGSVGSVTGAVGSVTGLTTATIADAVWDELQAGHVAVGSFGVTATEIADILVDTAEIGAAGAGLTALATASALSTESTKITAIKAKTDSLTFTVAGQVDANIQYVNDVQVNGTGASGSAWGP